VTVSFTGYVPGKPNAWVAVAPLALCPSPKLHSEEAMVPSGSAEPALENVAAWPSPTDPGAVNVAVGGWSSVSFSSSSCSSLVLVVSLASPTRIAVPSGCAWMK
jgi:hypothetical protein